jgi:protein-tyrosine phosphatase
VADWITDQIAIGMWDESEPEMCVRYDLRDVPDHCAIAHESLARFVGRVKALTSIGVKVFVHCIGGVSRSPSFVAAYIATTEGISVDDAIARIKARRPIIQPHPDQIASVKAFVEAQRG